LGRRSAAPGDACTKKQTTIIFSFTSSAIPQLSDVGRNPPRFIFAEQLGPRSTSRLRFFLQRRADTGAFKAVVIATLGESGVP
jgi:hypothetical protein